MNGFRPRGGFTAWPNEMTALALNARPPVNMHVLAAVLFWMEFKPEGSDVRLPDGRTLHIERGQALVSYAGLANALGISIDAARRALRSLSRVGICHLSRAGSATSAATPPTLVDLRKWGEILWSPVEAATSPATGPATPAASRPATPVATPAATIQHVTPQLRTPEPEKLSLVAEASASDDGRPFAQVLEVWDRVCVPAGFAHARSTPQQRKAARARMREPEWFEAFKAACAYVAREPFYRGAGTSGWVLTLGWLLKPGNAEKTAERAATQKLAAGPPRLPRLGPPRSTGGAPPDYTDPASYAEVSIKEHA